MVRLSESDRRLLLKRLDVVDQQGGAWARQHARVEPPTGVRVIFEMVQSDLLNRYFVVPRDVSAGGVSFLHGSFVHTGTPVGVVFITRSGDMLKVQGRVVRCRHAQASEHEVGVEFETELDLKSLAAEHNSSANPHASLVTLAAELRELAEQRSPAGPLRAKLRQIAESLSRVAA
jgi:hypothetical protein